MEQVMICFSHTHAAPNAAVEKNTMILCASQFFQGWRRRMNPWYLYTQDGELQKTRLEWTEERVISQLIHEGILKICGEDQEKI